MFQFCTPSVPVQPLPRHPLHHHSVPFLSLNLPALHKPDLLVQPLQPSRKRRLLRDLQRAVRLQLGALHLQRLGRLNDFSPQRLGPLLVAAVVEREFLFEAVSRLRVFEDGGFKTLETGAIST